MIEYQLDSLNLFPFWEHSRCDGRHFVGIGTNRTHWFGHSVSRNKFVRVSCKKCGERAPTTLHPALCGICLIARWRRRGEFQ